MAIVRYMRFLFILTLETAIVNCDDCPVVVSERVDLSLIEFCQSYPEVTVRCTVYSDGNALIWGWETTEPRSGTSEPNTCPAICTTPDVHCFEELNSVRVTNCTCNDTIIISEAIFELTFEQGVILYCEDNKGSVRDNISASIPSISAPLLSYQIIDSDSKEFKAVISWQAVDATPHHNVRYNISVTNTVSQQHQGFSSRNTQMNLTLCRGIVYRVRVVAEICDGKLSSNASSELRVFLAEEEVTVNSSATMSRSPTPTKPGQTGGSSSSVAETATISGIVIAVIAVLVLIAIAIVLIFLRMKKGSLANASRTMLSTFYRSNVTKRSGVAGLHIEQNCIYYSCTEEYGNQARSPSKKYILKKCTLAGEVLSTVRCDDFVRGIGKDGNGYMYVLISRSDSFVMKFKEVNKQYRFVGRTSDDCGKDLGESYGLLVESDNVVVCAMNRDQVCFFDLDLTFRYKVDLRFAPIGIARLQDKYFVTSKVATIGVIDSQSRDVRMLKYYTQDGKKVPLRQNVKVRGICSGKSNYLYTTGISTASPCTEGYFLCLRYNEKEGELHFVFEKSEFSDNCNDSNDECWPVIVAYQQSADDTTSHQNIVTFSQGSYGRNFHIIKATHDLGTADVNTELLFHID